MKLSTLEPVPDITDYKYEFKTQKFQTTDPIWRNKIILKKYLDEIQYTEVFVVADGKTGNANIPKKYALQKKVYSVNFVQFWILYNDIFFCDYSVF